MQKLSGARYGILAGIALAVLWSGMVPAAAQSFNDWGWPQPYEKVSEKSIAWLKQKGWWPLAVGWQGPFSGQNTVNVVMDKAGLLEKRGLARRRAPVGTGIGEGLLLNGSGGRGITRP